MGITEGLIRVPVRDCAGMLFRKCQQPLHDPIKAVAVSFFGGNPTCKPGGCDKKGGGGVQNKVP